MQTHLIIRQQMNHFLSPTGSSPVFESDTDLGGRVLPKITFDHFKIDFRQSES